MKKFLMLGLVAGAFALTGANYAEAAGPCCCQPGVAAATQAPVATAQAPQAVRSFSYDPAMAPAPAYYPARRFSPTRTPGWLLPKSDPRKFGVN
jgi:hypothetical protein